MVQQAQSKRCGETLLETISPSASRDRSTSQHTRHKTLMTTGIETLVRIDPSGKRTTMAGPDQGKVGFTACAFGRAPGDENVLYASTDGGFTVPHERGVEDAKLVRFEVGESGYRLLGER